MLIYSTTFMLCLIAAPLIAQYQQRKPATVFARAALVYLIFGSLSFLDFETILASDLGLARMLTYVIVVANLVNDGHVAFAFGVVMGFFSVATNAQTRLGIMLYPIATSVTFWLIHLGFVGTILLPGFATIAVQSVNSMSGHETITILRLIANFSFYTLVSGVTGFAVLLVYSVFVAKRRTRRFNN